jgi:hypothetical protein
MPFAGTLSNSAASSLLAVIFRLKERVCSPACLVPCWIQKSWPPRGHPDRASFHVISHPRLDLFGFRCLSDFTTVLLHQIATLRDYVIHINNVFGTLLCKPSDFTSLHYTTLLRTD